MNCIKKNNPTDFFLGVGNVTIVDSEQVTKEDIQRNFFLDPDSAGQSKAKSASDLLQELNEDAQVKHVEQVSEKKQNVLSNG